MNKKIKEAIALLENLHGCIDEMDHWLNERLREMSIINLAVFEATLEKDRAKIIVLQSRKTLTFSIPVDEESDKEAEALFDINRNPVDHKDKWKIKRSGSDEKKRIKKKEKYKKMNELKEALRRMKEDSEIIEEAVRARAVGESAS